MRMIEANFIVKLNAVVMHGMNETDILPLVNFTEKHPVSVRFIEEMPFNGSGLVEEKLFWDYRRILSHIKTEFPTSKKCRWPTVKRQKIIMFLVLWGMWEL